MKEEWEKIPLFRKAEEIRKLAFTLAETLGENVMTEALAEQICMRAATIPAKIAGASGCDLYHLRMENAVIIKIEARDLRSLMSMVDMLDLNHKSYTDLLRKHIEEFRVMFLDWIDSFDPMENSDDGWGIFV